MAYRFPTSFGLFLLVLILPLTAFAERDEDAYQEMLDLSNAAAEAVADGQFAIGAVKFRQAYDSYPDPILLNNEMIAWYRAGDCRKALPPAQLFLETGDSEDDDIDSEDRNDVETVLIECHLEMAYEALEEDNSILATYHLDTLSPFERTDDEEQSYQRLRDELSDMDLADSDGDDFAPTFTSSQTLGWAQIAGGIAVAGIGLSLHSVALSRQSQLQDLADSGETEMLEARQEQWGSYQRTTRWAVPTLYVLGGAAIGSGIYFLMRPSATDDSLVVVPQLGTEQAGFSLTGSF